MASCSGGNSSDALQLLQTVPSDASFVGVVNLGRIIEADGGKVKDGEARPSEKITRELPTSGDAALIARALLTADAGVDADCVVVFTEGYRTYLAGALRDPEAFITYWQKRGRKFELQEGAQVAGNVAFVKNNFWICLTGTPDASRVKSYAEMSENLSWASRDYAVTLAEPDKDMKFAADAPSVVRGIASDRARELNMLLPLMFKDPAFLAGDVQFEKGKATATCRVLDSKFRPTDFALPLGKIDTEIVKKLNCSAESLFAVSIPGKAVKYMEKNMAGGLMPKLILAYLKPIDGTVALALNSAAGHNACGVAVQTNGEPTAELTDLLSGLNHGGIARTEGKVFLYSVPGIVGKLPAANFADDFKGAMAGVVVNTGAMAAYGSAADASLLDRVSLMLLPKGSGAELKLTAVCADKKTSFFVTSLRLMAARK